MRLLQPPDRLESFEQLARFRSLGLSLERRAELLDDLGVHPRMLADVQGVQVESEFPKFSQQRADVSAREAFSAIGNQAVPNKQEILLELRRAHISVRSLDGIARVLQPVKHVRAESTIAFCLIVRTPCEMNAGNRTLVMFQTIEKVLRHT